jgi:flagellar hook-basal body complex protein FliE
MPIDPSFSIGGPEWQVGGVSAPDPAAPTGTGSSFGGALGQALGSLQASQEEAAQGAQALATGTADDPTSVVMSVERARLAMQLASQIRTKAVEAAQDLFHTQV